MLAEFLLAVLVIEITPGPNLGYLAALSATRGRIAGLAATAGVALGLATHALAATLGVGALVASSAWAYELLRWAGVIVLVWLAYEGWAKEAETSPADTGLQDYAGFFWRGFVTNVLNPKSALFFVAVVPRFLDPANPQTLRLGLLGAIYVAVATAVHAGVVLLASRMKPILVKGSRQRLVRRGLALVLLGLALWLAWGTSRASA